MSDYLIATDAVGPLHESDSAAGALGVANALASAGHRVSVLSLAPPGLASQQPGLARRLRTVSVSVAGRSAELPLFEGRSSSSSAHLYVLGTDETGPGRKAALLASAAASLARDGLLSPEVILGWGELTAPTLKSLTANTRLLVLPERNVGSSLDAEQLEALGETDDLGAGSSLLARGLFASDAVVVPTTSAAERLSALPEMSARASDQPIVVVPLGADEPPHDPESDAAVAMPFSADRPTGKTECRRLLARRLSLAVGSKTLVVATPPLEEGRGGNVILTALSQMGGLDLAVVVRTGPDRALAERAKVLAIQFPGKIAIVPAGTGATNRELMAGADAVLLPETDEFTSRPPGLAQRYGALPIAPGHAAFADLLVDFDPRSQTGNSLLYAPGNAFELLGAIRRAVALRADAEAWGALTVTLMRTAPRWATTAARIDSLREPTQPQALTAP